MSATRAFLDRFRPAGAPGAAGGAGVPADLAREPGAGVGPVLALLDNTHAECERLIAAAWLEADRIAAETHAGTARFGQEAGDQDLIPVAVGLAAGVDGVVAVVSQLTRQEAHGRT